MIATLIAAASLAAPAPAPETSTPAPAPREEAPRVAAPSDRSLPAADDVLAESLRPKPGGLTAQIVATKAVESSPSIAIKQADLRIAAARVDQAIVAFVPQVQVSASYTRLSNVNVFFGEGALVGAQNPGPLSVGACPDGTQTCVVDAQGSPVGASSFTIPQVLDNYSLQAKLSVPISDYVLRIVRGLRAARLSREAAGFAEQAERAKVEVDARVAYYNWVRAVAQVAATRDAQRTARARLDDAKLRYNVGYLTQADVARIEALVASAEAATIEAEAFEELARENIAVIMDEPVHDWVVGENVLTAPGSVSARPRIHALVDEAVRNRYEIKTLSTNTQALHEGIRTERAGYFPRLDGFAETTYANPNQRFFPPTDEFNNTWSAGLQLSYTLNAPLAARQKIKELRAQKRGLVAQREAIERGIRLEVTSAYIDRKRALAALAVAKTNRSAVEYGYQAVAASFKAGNATVTDVIESQGERLTAQLQELNAGIDLKVADTKLDYATGTSRKR